MNSLEQELRDLVVLFNRERVEYALCEGMAVALHGYRRFTKDIDFLHNCLETATMVSLCAVSVEGLVEMKLAAGRDQDLLDIKQLGFERDDEQSE